MLNNAAAARRNRHVAAAVGTSFKGGEWAAIQHPGWQLQNAKPTAGSTRAHVPQTCHHMHLYTQASDDISLSVRLFRRCLNDQRKFCADVEPGHMRVQVRAVLAVCVALSTKRSGSGQPATLQGSNLVLSATSPADTHPHTHTPTQHTHNILYTHRSALKIIWTRTISARAAKRTWQKSLQSASPTSGAQINSIFQCDFCYKRGRLRGGAAKMT